MLVFHFDVVLVPPLDGLVADLVLALSLLSRLPLTVARVISDISSHCNDWIGSSHGAPL